MCVCGANNSVHTLTGPGDAAAAAAAAAVVSVANTGILENDHEPQEHINEQQQQQQEWKQPGTVDAALGMMDWLEPVLAGMNRDAGIMQMQPQQQMPLGQQHVMGASDWGGPLPDQPVDITGKKRGAIGSDKLCGTSKASGKQTSKPHPSVERARRYVGLLQG